MIECNGDHKRVVVDSFAQLTGVGRYVPGDCYCLDCKEPLPFWWNGGKPIPADPEKKERK